MDNFAELENDIGGQSEPVLVLLDNLLFVLQCFGANEQH